MNTDMSQKNTNLEAAVTLSGGSGTSPVGLYGQAGDLLQWAVGLQ